MLKKGLIALAAILVVLIAVAAMQPSEFPRRAGRGHPRAGAGCLCAGERLP
jgi:hypothetical protein